VFSEALLSSVTWFEHDNDNLCQDSRTVLLLTAGAAASAKQYRLDFNRLKHSTVHAWLVREHAQTNHNTSISSNG
jgi:hypothetical protein